MAESLTPQQRKDYQGIYGFGKTEFRELHSDRGCLVEKVFLGTEETGLYNATWEDIVVASVFRLVCRTHEVNSASYWGPLE